MFDPRSALRLRWARGAAFVIALVVVLSGWLLAAPPGASPDDEYHLTSIWCAEGYQDGLCLADVGSAPGSRVLVPLSVLDLTCFQHDGRRSAACATASLQSPLQQFTPVRGSNINGERPNTYYRAMHLLIGDDLAGSLARMRAANLVLIAAMVALTALVAPPRVRRAFLLSTLVASIPLGFFLMTSLNSSAWGLAGLTTLWANILTSMLHTRTLNRLTGAGLAGLGLVLGLGSRTEASLHITVTAAALAMIWWGTQSQTGRQLHTAVLRRSVAIALTGGGLVLSLVLLSPGSARLDRLFKDITFGYERLSNRGIGDPFLAIAFEVPSLWSGAVGHIWGLGALDTPIPMLATLPSITMFAMLLTVGLQGATRSRTLAATAVGVSLFVMPMLSLMRSGLLVYEQLQPRQFMVMLYLILGLALVRLPWESDLAIGPAMRALAIFALGLSHSVALLVTMRRHISGLVEFRYVSFASEVEWWWSAGPGPNTVWAAASIAFVIALSLVLRMFPSTSRAHGAGVVANP